MQAYGFLFILINILPWEAGLLINGTVNVKAHCFNQIKKQGTQKFKMHNESNGFILYLFIIFCQWNKAWALQC